MNTSNPTRPRLTVIGTGYLGATHAACMAELGFEVLGLDVDPEKVEYTCEKDGFRTVEVMHRKMSSAKLSPIEIECLLARN